MKKEEKRTEKELENCLRKENDKQSLERKTEFVYKSI